MIPEKAGLLRGSNNARLLKVGTGCVTKDTHGDSVLGELSSPYVLRGANDVAGGHHHLI